MTIFVIAMGEPRTAKHEVGARTRADGLPADLNFPVEPALVTRVLRLSVQMHSVLDAAAARFDLSGADYLIVGVLYHSPQHRNSPTGVAAALDRTTGGLTAALDRLEVRGLLRRLPDSSDRRRLVLEATSDGIALAENVIASLFAWEASLEMSDQTRKRFGDAISTLSALVAKHGTNGFDDQTEKGK